jgi:Ni2+-binding GTPase involved in maturation of urease and hydrogenase
LSCARYIFLAGFLGAGKTTTLAAAAVHFQRQGRRVAVVTNDLGGELVDTAALRAGGLAVEEITGGTLAARFGSLVQAVRRLDKAEVVLVEAVGCLADLASEVLAPLRRELGDDCALTSLSVLVDPRRAGMLFNQTSTNPDTEPLRYLCRRQLEEADVIVLTQVDRLDDKGIAELRSRLGAEFPRTQVLAVSARNGSGVPEWLAQLEAGAGRAPVVEIDYNRYAQAVAQLGWLDATIEFVLARTIGGSALLRSVGRHLQAALSGVDLAHLKVALRTEETDELGLLHLVPGQETPELARACDAPLETGELIVNLRAANHPEKLHTAVGAAMVELTREFPGLQTEFAHLHYFRPARPSER